MTLKIRLFHRVSATKIQKNPFLKESKTGYIYCDCQLMQASLQDFQYNASMFAGIPLLLHRPLFYGRTPK